MPISADTSKGSGSGLAAVPNWRGTLSAVFLASFIPLLVGTMAIGGYKEQVANLIDRSKDAEVQRAELRTQLNTFTSTTFNTFVNTVNSALSDVRSDVKANDVELRAKLSSIAEEQSKRGARIDKLEGDYQQLPLKIFQDIRENIDKLITAQVAEDRIRQERSDASQRELENIANRLNQVVGYINAQAGKTAGGNFPQAISPVPMPGDQNGR